MTVPAATDHTAEATAERAERAAAAAHDFERLALQERIELLHALADHLAGGADDLVPIAAAESHLPVDRLRGEIARSVGQFQHFASELLDGTCLDITIDLADPGARPPRPDLRRSNVGLGPIAVYAASNFPFAFGAVGTDVAATLAAGCPVVIKAHPLQPATADASAALLRSALHRFGVTEDIIQLVHGFEAGRSLIREPAIKAAAFTGSVAGGRALWDLACARPEPIPFYGELGSVNPVIIGAGSPGFDSHVTAQQLAGSITTGAGQFCTRPSLLLIPASEAGDVFVDELLSALKVIPPAPMLSDEIMEAFLRSDARLAARPEVDALLPAGVDEAGVPSTAVLSVRAHAFLADTHTFDTEVFGPFALVVRYDSAGELLAVMQALPGSLTCTFLGGTDAVTPELIGAARAKAGRLLGAGVPTGVSVTRAQMHGGTWPAATISSSSSVGALGLRRFMRAIAYQEFDERLLPAELRNDNPLGLLRRINGAWTRGPISAET